MKAVHFCIAFLLVLITGIKRYGQKLHLFQKTDLITYDLIRELAGKIGAEQWIEIYESNLKSGASKK